MNRPVALDYLLLVGISLIWGSQFVLNELAIRSFSPLVVATGRVLIGFFTLTIIALVMYRRSANSATEGDRQPWSLYCAIAIAEAILPCFLIPWGQQHVDSSIAAILLATVPIFTLILAPFFVKDEHWSLIAALSVIVGFIGVLVLIVPSIKGSWLANIIGELAIMGGALSFSASLIMMKHLSNVPPVLAMRNVFMIASAVLVVLTLILSSAWKPNPEWQSITALMGLGVFCGGVAYVLFIYMVGRTGPTFTALSGYLITLVGVFIGIAFLGERLQVNDILALILIIAALFIGKFKS
ncbi:putative DMT superfamily transporter inner membrane protein [Ruegeria denitrificans]|uniref:Putative DMT superfamily transporter inner membrane protein n=1 Tax=Ruegeria denitrificans TaxID=1715692 RepID=A0A0P1IF30_9RHOB|nr:DMT family transporter [Ruegeria denitrificans]CUJ95632.1 putative DMT superfamily transporter inner membrane protein [Ruegeria denitrificans]